MKNKIYKPKKNTFETCLQLYLKAYDALRPRNVARFTAYITVQRNTGFPEWVFLVPDVTMREDHPVYLSVAQVEAVDRQDNVGHTLSNSLICFCFKNDPF